jgi:predicted O-methyltransferase YrrM
MDFDNNSGDGPMRDFFAGLVSFIGAKTVVEVGVAGGWTTAALCAGCSDNGGIVYGFDCWANPLGHVAESYCSLDEASGTIRAYGFGNFKLFQVDTTKASFDELLNQHCPVIDFAFLDGDHRYEGIENDFLKVYPHLAPTGVIMFHDTYRIDGVRAMMLALRDKYNDHTFDLVEFPFGTPRQYGVSMLVKRTKGTVFAPGVFQIKNPTINLVDMYAKELENLTL